MYIACMESKRDIALALKQLGADISESSHSKEIEDVMAATTAIILDPKADQDDKEMAITTLLDAVYGGSNLFFPPTDEEMATARAGNDRDVHTEHCCVIHGCKYSNDDCTVASEEKIQSFPCETCEMERHR